MASDETLEATEASTEGTASPEPSDTSPASSNASEEAMSALYDKLMESGDDDTSQNAPNEAQSKNADQPQGQDGEAVDQPPISRPASWSPDFDSSWSTLPRPVQEQVIKREREASQRIEQLGKEANRLRPLGQFVDQYGQVFASHGKEPVEALDALVQAQVLLDSDPVVGLMAIANAYGIDLNQLGHQTDAQLLELKSEIAALRSQQQMSEYRTLSERQAQAEQQFSGYENAIDVWSEGKEHMEEVMPLLAGMIRQVDGTGKTEQQILDEAYDMAVWAIPNARTKLLQAEASKKEAAAKKQQRSADASRNKAGNAGTSGYPGSVGSKGFDMDAEYDAIMSRMNG